MKNQSGALVVAKVWNKETERYEIILTVMICSDDSPDGKNVEGFDINVTELAEVGLAKDINEA